MGQHNVQCSYWRMFVLDKLTFAHNYLGMHSSDRLMNLHTEQQQQGIYPGEGKSKIEKHGHAYIHLHLHLVI